MRAAILGSQNVVINIAKASPEFAESQGWIVSDTAKIGDEYDPETGTFNTPVPPPIPLEEAKATQIETINGAYTEAIAPLISEYPDPEPLSWAHQDTEAQAYLAWHANGAEGEPPSAPVLEQILAGRNGEDGNETMLELCEAVERNAVAFRQAQVLTGTRQRLVRLVREAESVEEAEAVVWAV